MEFKPDYQQQAPAGFLTSFKEGFLDCSPFLLGLIPFAIIYGASAKAVGLTLPETLSMSLFVFAGSAQLTFVNLWALDVTIPVLVLTCLALNLRLLIYSASIGIHLGPPTGLGTALLRSYLLTDESFAVSLTRFCNKSFSCQKLPFFLGSGLPVWLGWQSMGLFGYVAGSVIPQNWPIFLAVPLVFLALLISILKVKGSQNLPKCLAAAAGGIAAILLRNVPMNFGLLLAIIFGVAVGVAAESIFKRPK
jgi:predicted branched-subunit amino acid permease